MAIVIQDGQVFTGLLTAPAGQALIVEQGGLVQGDVVLKNAGVLPSLDNSGAINSTGQAVFIDAPNGQDLTIVNNADGLIEGAARAIRVSSGNFEGSTVTIVNAGRMVATTGQTIRLDDAAGGRFIIDNRAGGLIFNNAPGQDIIRVDDDTKVINAGVIDSAPDRPNVSRGGDGVDFKDGTGSSLHNLAGGYISASRHAVTGEMGLIVVNEAGGVLVGRNGSAVNIDNDASIENTVYVTNHGLMQGKSAQIADSDGDAVDTDGLAVIDNYGVIEGLGHNGYHDGEPNVSEAVAIGGGVVNNYAGATIYGYGRAIQADNSGNGSAFTPTTIYNEGLIKGDGNAPTDVTPEEVALFAARIRGGEAINLVGDFADIVTNAATGQIVGGIKAGGGDDVLTNAGAITATGGSAVDLGGGDDAMTNRGAVVGDILLGDGDDKINFLAGSSVHGHILAGAGDDTVVGGAGVEVITGGAGDDLMSGGGDKDIFILTAGFGHDVIADFNKGLDSLDWSAMAGSPQLSVVSGDTILAFVDGSVLVLEDVVAPHLSQLGLRPNAAPDWFV